ncbi:ABC transporter ATP-binding protein [Paramagnetospirillum magnetotacticum MS-1]|uniref:ABC transporter ATP-binding protein n=1 Tax=Paramagnetospirillum magnetotacticum MS-1 TaxID=272627 RepID=A0A0C2YWV8_PARME|nr:ATP-binding cassette domain-containing protein [Paramagnetospirillum magnetotacticum]KIL99588.1 ABC transporter ATP-binding protein [Paramagnetospirillum magnetotacticum MS-1]
MARINLTAVDVTFRIFDAGQRSFTRHLLPGTRAEKGLEIAALSAITLVLEPGSRIALLGPNSSGKTTMLRVMAGLVPPLRGTASIHGRPGAVFSIGFGALPEASLADLAYAQGLLMGVPPALARAKVDEILDFAEIRSQAKCPAHVAPPGVLSRLGTAAALCLNADILLFDEVLDNMDPHFHGKLETAIAERIDSGAILVMAERSRGLLSRFCSEALLLCDGQLSARGPLDAILRDGGASLTF